MDFFDTIVNIIVDIVILEIKHKHMLLLAVSKLENKTIIPLKIESRNETNNIKKAHDIIVLLKLMFKMYL